MSLVVKAKVKDYADQVASERVSVSSDFADALNEKVQELIKDAVKRARANNRKTIMAKDL